MGGLGKRSRRPFQLTPRATAQLQTHRVPGVLARHTVRRMTPRECERLQGFPDDWTLVPYRGGMAADTPRYRALGNSWAVPVARWIGERIARYEIEEGAIGI